jgi:receptor protein-tyrosine kinase
LKADQALTSVDGYYTTLEKLGLMNMLDEEELGNLRVLQKATDSAPKVSPNRARVLAMGGIVGSMIGFVLALALGFMDATLRRPGELRGIGASPVLGVVKDLGRKMKTPATAISDPSSPWAPLVHGMWPHLRRVCLKRETARIAFSALQPGAGVSTVSAWIIETDFDSPGLAESLELVPGPGLSDVLNGTASLEEAIQKTQVPGLSILGAGQSEHPGPGWYAMERTKEVLAQASRGVKYVLLDLPPVSSDPETRMILWDSDASVFVARAGKTRKKELKILLRSLGESGLPLLGSVVNRYRSAKPFWIPGRDGELVADQATSVPLA